MIVEPHPPAALLGEPEMRGVAILLASPTDASRVLHNDCLHGPCCVLTKQVWQETMKTRVLCIDDDQDHCELLEMALSGMGFTPTTMTSPLAALELVARTAFDVVVTDLGMEEMDGLALCERVLGARPGIPIIVLTGQSSMETAIRAMRAMCMCRLANFWRIGTPIFRARIRWACWYRRATRWPTLPVT